jgi:DNA polymerase III epsilon subunit family exonuclease
MNLSKNKNKREYIIFDLETTGLDVNKDKIVEFACCIINNKGKEIKERFSLLINPETKIPQRVINIHGINDSMVADKPIFRDIAHIIQKKFMHRIAVAYSGFTFDFPFLKNEFLKSGIPFDYFGCIDPKIRTQCSFKEFRSHSLINISKHFNFRLGRPHRALDDVILLKKLFKKMYISKKTYVKNNTYDVFDNIPDIVVNKIPC